VSPVHPSPPFDPWLWVRAWNETWLAGAWPPLSCSLRAQRLAALLGAARRGSPLYRRRSGGAHAFEDFAPIDKCELMQGFDDWATDRRITRAAAEAFLADAKTVGDGWLGGDYLLWSSSGTSGVPGWFVQDAASLAAYDAIDALRMRGAAPAQPALGLWGLDHRFAFVGACGGHFAGVVSMERLRRIVPAPLQPRIAIISVLQPLRDVATQVKQFSPTVLITYPSVAEALAPLQRAGALALRLHEIWVGGEQLSSAQREEVQSAFGCTVRNSYGASECFSIAWECGQGQLHLNDDWVVLEPVDEHLRPVPPGTLSHTTLVTNLANRIQPIIRYQLDDRVRVLPGRCRCGSTFTRVEVEGRSGDTLHLPDTRRQPVAILPLALETAIEEGARVTQFQVIDHARRGGHTLELRFEPAVTDPAAAFARCQAAIGHYLAAQGVTSTRCSFCAEPPRREAASGKLRRVVQGPAGGARATRRAA